MTGADTNPSLSPDTPPASQNNTVTDVDVVEPAASALPAEPAAAPSVTGEQTSDGYPYTQGVDDGRLRTRIVVRPRRPLPDEEVEGAAPTANDRSADDPVPAFIPERPTDFERERLNWVHSYYRGTVAGTIEQFVLYGLSHLADDEEETPRRRAEIEHYRPLYLNVVRDLDRADHLLRAADVTKASLTHDISTRSASPESTPPPVDSPVFARRMWPSPGGQSPSPLLIPSFPRSQGIRPFDDARSAPDSPGSIDRDSDDDDDVFIFAKFADDPDATHQEGRIQSDENADPEFVPGQRYAQRITQRNLAITGHRETDELTEMFLSVLGQTAKKMRAGRGSVFGIAVHKDFEERIDALKLPGVHVERSYDRSLKTVFNYGREGTIRTDVAKVRGNNTVAVWDLKTGRAVLRPSRARELAEATGVPPNRVIEINYVSRKALRRGW